MTCVCSINNLPLFLACISFQSEEQVMRMRLTTPMRDQMSVIFIVKLEYWKINSEEGLFICDIPQWQQTNTAFKGSIYYEETISMHRM